MNQLGFAKLTCIVDGNLHAQIQFINKDCWAKAKGNTAVLCWNDWYDRGAEPCAIMITRGTGMFAPLREPDEEIIVARPQRLSHIIVTEEKLKQMLDRFNVRHLSGWRLPVHDDDWYSGCTDDVIR